MECNGMQLMCNGTSYALSAHEHALQGGDLPRATARPGAPEKRHYLGWLGLARWGMFMR